MLLLETLNREQGVAIVLVTHDLEVAARARRQIRVRDGLLEPTQASGNPQHSAAGDFTTVGPGRTGRASG